MARFPCSGQPLGAATLLALLFAAAALGTASARPRSVEKFAGIPRRALGDSPGNGSAPATAPAPAAPPAGDAPSPQPAPASIDSTQAAPPPSSSTEGPAPSISAAPTSAEPDADGPSGAPGNATADPTAGGPTTAWSFPWRRFWIITGYICAGFCGAGALAGFAGGLMAVFAPPVAPTDSATAPDAGSGATRQGYSHSGTNTHTSSSTYSHTYSRGYSSGSSSDCNCAGSSGEAFLACCFCGLALVLALAALAIYSIMPAAAACIGIGIGFAIGAAVAALVVLICPCTAACGVQRAGWLASCCGSQAQSTSATAAPVPAPRPTVELPSAKVTSDDQCKPDGGSSSTREELHTVDLEASAPPQQASMV